MVLVHAMYNWRFKIDVKYRVDVHGMKDDCDQKESQQIELDHVGGALLETNKRDAMRNQLGERIKDQIKKE